MKIQILHDVVPFLIILSQLCLYVHSDTYTCQLDLTWHTHTHTHLPHTPHNIHLRTHATQHTPSHTPHTTHLHTHIHTVRLYDVNTLQCFVSADARDQHKASITSVSTSSGSHMTVMWQSCGRLSALLVFDTYNQNGHHPWTYLFDSYNQNGHHSRTYLW